MLLLPFWGGEGGSFPSSPKGSRGRWELSWTVSACPVVLAPSAISGQGPPPTAGDPYALQPPPALLSPVVSGSWVWGAQVCAVAMGSRRG